MLYWTIVWMLCLSKYYRATCIGFAIKLCRKNWQRQKLASNFCVGSILAAKELNGPVTLCSYSWNLLKKKSIFSCGKFWLQFIAGIDHESCFPFSNATSFGGGNQALEQLCKPWQRLDEETIVWLPNKDNFPALFQIQSIFVDEWSFLCGCYVRRQNYIWCSGG